MGVELRERTCKLAPARLQLIALLPAGLLHAALLTSSEPSKLEDVGVRKSWCSSILGYGQKWRKWAHLARIPRCIENALEVKAYRIRYASNMHCGANAYWPTCFSPFLVKKHVGQYASNTHFNTLPKYAFLRRARVREIKCRCGRPFEASGALRCP